MVLLSEIASMYNFVVDVRTGWGRLIKISFSYIYIQWRCAPDSHTGPRAHFSRTFHPVQKIKKNKLDYNILLTSIYNNYKLDTLFNKN